MPFQAHKPHFMSEENETWAENGVCLAHDRYNTFTIAILSVTYFSLPRAPKEYVSLNYGAPRGAS